MAHPDFLLIPEGEDISAAASDFAGKYLPVYPATGKIPSWKISQCIDLALNAVGEIDDPLPHWLREKMGYPELKDALRIIHRPTRIEEAELARERVTFDEALSLQLFLVQRREQLRSSHQAIKREKSGTLLEKFDQRLPFELTDGQKLVSREIESDLSSEHPMYRLLQGDVGSGKTIVALRTMLAMVDRSAQIGRAHV